MFPTKVLTINRKVDDRKGLPLVHFSGQPEPFLSLKSPNASHKKCLCPTEKWTSLSPWRECPARSVAGRSRAELHAAGGAGQGAEYRRLEHDASVHEEGMGLHASAFQLNPIILVHFSAQPEPILSLTPPNRSHKKCLPQAETRTSMSPCSTRVLLSSTSVIVVSLIQ